MEKPAVLVGFDGPDGKVDYGQLDRPMIICNKVASERYATGADGNGLPGYSTFLRCQAEIG